MPWHDSCALRSHFTVAQDRLKIPGGAGTREETMDALEARLLPEEVWRLADRILEPEDHLH